MTLVTSPNHTRRAEWTFARAMPDVRVSAVSDGEAFHSGTWFLHGSDVRSVVSEWGKGVGSLWYLVSPPRPLDPGMPC